MKQEKFLGDKENSDELLCNISSHLEQRMLGNFIIDEEKTDSSRTVVLHKYDDNAMNGACKQRRKLKKKWIRKGSLDIESERAEISDIGNDGNDA